MKRLLAGALLLAGCAHTTPPANQYTVEWLDDSKDEPMYACVSPEEHKLACRSYADIFSKVLQSFSDEELRELLHKLRPSPDETSGDLDQSESKTKTWETRRP